MCDAGVIPDEPTRASDGGTCIDMDSFTAIVFGAGLFTFGPRHVRDVVNGTIDSLTVLSDPSRRAACGRVKRKQTESCFAESNGL